MTGSAFITYDTGWSCSNDVVLDLHSEAIRTPEGKTTAIRKWQVLRVNGLYGNLIEDSLVKIAFKLDENEVLMGFEGRVKSIGQLTIINILKQTEQIKEILLKIV